MFAADHGAGGEAARGDEPSPEAARDSDAPTVLYRVEQGDSLWSIAADISRDSGIESPVCEGNTSSPTAIDHLWRTIYAANQVPIGPDPDLIHPGLELKIPANRCR